ncbi:hypothetical protein M8C21_002856, partial [Ambrosia artemisiifolia]
NTKTVRKFSLITNNNSKQDDQCPHFQLVPHSGHIEVGNYSHPEHEDQLTQPNLNNNNKLTYNIVFVTSEASPYSKTGGLCGSLPIALAARGHRVMVVSPRYSSHGPFAATANLHCPTKVDCAGGLQDLNFFHDYRKGVDWVFVDHPCYHRPGNPYGDIYGDNQFRFTLLCHAACEAPLGGFTYGQNCLFLANHCHAGLVPVLLAAKYRPHRIYKNARSIILIHNLAHQGVEAASTYCNLGLPWEWYGALEWIFPTWARTHALDTDQAVNILKGAIVTADRILTVSEGYAREITTQKVDMGSQMALMLLNAIHPLMSIYTSSHYTADDLSGKVMECKLALQKELGLPIQPDCPLNGMEVRVIHCWMNEDGILFQAGNISSFYDVCDILLMPSRFEPCGLNQLHAMRYGTVPVVNGIGGLREIFKTFNPYAEGEGEGTGWAFSRLTRECMLEAVRVATKTYREHKTSWEGLMKRGMESDCSWDNVALQYEQVFQWTLLTSN